MLMYDSPMLDSFRYECTLLEHVRVPDGMGGSYRGYSREGRGYSMAHGRMNAPRDSRGRYSGADDVESVKHEVRRLMEKIDKM